MQKNLQIHVILSDHIFKDHDRTDLIFKICQFF